MVLIQRKEYNILLLGQTGAGKSTFINGFLNYLSFQDIDGVLAACVRYCVPTIFEWYGKDEELQKVTVGIHEDQNEHLEIGVSATQTVKSYLFSIGDIGIRIIDTPGFGDTEGKERDEEISENLLQFLSVHEELRELHAIIFLLKPQDNRMTTFFQYFMNHIFSKLHKDASQNIIFVFTHTKGTDYKPGSTLPLVKKLINDLSDGKILCEKRNIFCVDNDCIKYLLACFYHDDGLAFDDVTKNLYTSSWKKSSGECIRLIKYIKTLEPHSMRNTLAINLARSYVGKLQGTLPQILEQIDGKTNECRRIEKEINDCELNIDKLKNAQYKCIIIKEAGYNVICQNRQCRKRENNISTIACCTNCTALRLGWCQKMSFSSICKNCGCNALDHAFSKSEVEKREKDENISEDLEHRQKILNQSRLSQFEQKINILKYQAEKEFIQKCAEELTHFLERISIYSKQNRQADADRDNGDSIGELNKGIGEMEKQLLSLQMTGEIINKVFRKEDIVTPDEKPYSINPVLESWKDVCEV